MKLAPAHKAFPRHTHEHSVSLGYPTDTLCCAVHVPPSTFFHNHNHFSPLSIFPSRPAPGAKIASGESDMHKQSNCFRLCLGLPHRKSGTTSPVRWCFAFCIHHRGAALMGSQIHGYM